MVERLEAESTEAIRDQLHTFPAYLRYRCV